MIDRSSNLLLLIACRFQHRKRRLAALASLGAVFIALLPPARISLAAVAPLETPPGQVLVLNANVLLGAKADGALSSCPNQFPRTPDYNTNKTCDPAGRRLRFAQRIQTLSLKLVADGVLEDGMGFAPDIITLQEIYRSDALTIRDHLNSLTGHVFDYRVAIDDSTAPSSTNGHNAIIYSHTTMRKVGGGGFIVTSGGGTGSKGTPYIGFREVLANPTTGLAIAVASLHFPRVSAFNAGEDASVWKGQWSEKIAETMESTYATAFNGLPADRYVIAGDFNAGKCEGMRNPVGDDPADQPRLSTTDVEIHENPACVPRPFWSKLASLGYVDTVYAANSATIDFQYQDGTAKREFRIDHIFAKGGNSYLDASFDLTCGEVASESDPQKRTCGWLRSTERYSDHRLNWALLGLNPSPL